jgi:GH24 family phage-related lysozyme (muramidase)
MFSPVPSFGGGQDPRINTAGLQPFGVNPQTLQNEYLKKLLEKDSGGGSRGGEQPPIRSWTQVASGILNTAADQIQLNRLMQQSQGNQSGAAAAAVGNVFGGDVGGGEEVTQGPAPQASGGGSNGATSNAGGGGGGGGAQPVPYQGDGTPDALVKFVKGQEGYNPNAYPDGKQISIGWGTRAQPGEKTISREDAEQRLHDELGKSAAAVEAFAPHAPNPIKQALTDLTYNAGTKWQGSGLGQAVQAGDWGKAKELFTQYSHADGQFNRALYNRRQSMAPMFDLAGQGGGVQSASMPMSQGHDALGLPPVQGKGDYTPIPASLTQPMSPGGPQGAPQGGPPPAVAQNAPAGANPPTATPAAPAAPSFIPPTAQIPKGIGQRIQQQLSSPNPQVQAEGRRQLEDWDKRLNTMEHIEIGGVMHQGNAYKGYKPLGGQKPDEFKEIGKDAFGNPNYGFVNPYTHAITPAKQGQKGSFDTENVNWDLSGDDFINQFPKPIQSQIHAYVEGRQMPTGNPRSGNTAMVKQLAQKYGDDIGFPADDTTFRTRQTMRNGLSQSTPGSLGGQINNGNTAIGHLSDLADVATKLDNQSWGVAPLSHAVNATKNLFGDKSAVVQDMKDTALHYGQEITKFYSGSGGGVEERTRFEQAISNANTPKELASVLSREAELMQSKLGALGTQIKGTLGEKYLNEHPVINEQSSKAIERLQGSLAKLNGLGATEGKPDQPKQPPASLTPQSPPTIPPAAPGAVNAAPAPQGGANFADRFNAAFPGVPPSASGPMPPATAQPGQPSQQSLMRQGIRNIGPQPNEAGLIPGAHEPTPGEMTAGSAALLGAPFAGLAGRGAVAGGPAAARGVLGVLGSKPMEKIERGTLMWYLLQSLIGGH